MNEININDIESINQEYLSDFGLDNVSLRKLKHKKNKLESEEQEKLDKELFELIDKEVNSHNENDHLEEIEKLLSDGANPNFKGSQKGQSVMHLCSMRKMTSTFALLIKYGADINITTNYGTTCLMFAARHRAVDIVKILLILGVDPNVRAQGGETAIMSAKRHNSEDCFKLLVEYNAYLNIRNTDNETLNDIHNSIKFEELNNIKTLNKSDIEKEEINSEELIEEASKKLAKLLN